MIRTGLAILAGTVMAACAAAQAQSNPPATPPTQPAPAPNATNNVAIPNGPAVTAELNGSVDSKKVKVGDKVEAHTTEALKNGNDVIVPKGTKLIGHVTQATARSKGDSDSSLAIQFDTAQPKKEQEIPLTVTILAVAAPEQVNMGGGGAPGPDSSPTAGTATGSQSSPMGASRPPAPNSSASPAPSGADTTGSGATSQPGAAGTLPANSRGIYGLKDLKLMLPPAKSGPPTTVITSTGKDVRLDSGTRLLLVTSGAPAAPASGQ
jgi:hypothetical protein